MADIPGSIVAAIKYAHPDNPPGIFFALSHGESTCTFEEHDTIVRDARQFSSAVGLSQSGFALVEHTTAMRDFDDPVQIDTVYAPEIEALVKKLTGASRVIVFHKLARYEGGEAVGKRQPAGNAHIDYTRESFEQWARQELGAAVADPLLERRWAAINVWRGLGRVERRPLAFADGTTIADTSLVPVPIHDRPGEPTRLVGLNLRYDPRQCWYYYPFMMPDEALVFTLFDSASDKPQRVAHSAINDPASPTDARPRASFEVRTIAFY